LETEEIISRTTIQCFDMRTLHYIHRHYPEIKLSLLIENTNTPEENLEALGFIPYIYSPDYQLVDERLMHCAKNIVMKILPWTVNTIEDAQRLIGLGVTGIITDYPNLFKKAQHV
jgi:glycerophosphoryl diester phosphodiesterase